MEIAVCKTPYHTHMYMYGDSENKDEYPTPQPTEIVLYFITKRLRVKYMVSPGISGRILNLKS